ncbi:chorismate pyruvate-lyase family protein [Nakamurella leprariae]|uniref:DUF98 domain-containing protein n=1 Tax=Nakamurella leprariae TaxID=2803911 RepID=A0A939C0L7_9ACTN|nr:chorismate pyruvate-lyase family protein [Nakamurella leprariae]MBM9469360.1 DUF98 domain-containing protein [Nakamurella leprariae]
MSEPRAVPGLGLAEQLVLRGDGLTTTSLEILSGARITTAVRAHWMLPLHADSRALNRVGGEPTPGADDLAGADGYTGMAATEPGRWAQLGIDDLDAQVGESLLVRELDLLGAGRILACATLVAVMGVLPPSLVHVLGTTDEPIGRLLAAHGIQVRRELVRWGLRPAGDLAERLAVAPAAAVPARSYRMRATSSGRPLALITEWFTPTLFGPPATAGDRRRRR